MDSNEYDVDDMASFEEFTDQWNIESSSLLDNFYNDDLPEFDAFDLLN